MTALAVALLVAAAPVPKETAREKIARVWGVPTDPENTDAFRLDDGQLKLTVAKGLRGINPSRGLNNCPRTLKPVTGDFVAEIKLVRDPLPAGVGKANEEYTASGGGGLIAWADMDNHLRLNRSQWIPDGGIKAKSAFNYRGNIGGDEAVNQTAELPAPDYGPCYLRLARKGGAFEASYSTDGKAWTKFPLAETEFPAAIHIGVYGAHNFNMPNDLVFDPLTVKLLK